MSSSRENLIMVLRAERTRKAQRRVVERTLAGLCLVPLEDGSDCNNPEYKAGQCQCHYNEQYRIECKMTPAARAAYRQRTISLGYRLGEGEIGRIKKRSVLKRLA